MNKLFGKIGAGIAAGALLASVMAPAAFASTTITISHNGRNSNNNAWVINSNSSSVSQANTTIVETGLWVNSNTGHNNTNGNTGGSINTDTGNAASSASVSVAGNINQNTSTPCGCVSDTTIISIINNGHNSTNNAWSITTNSSNVEQGNTTAVSVEAWVNSNTGHNNANGNTGGSVTTDTGTSNSSIGVSVGGSLNTN